MSMTRKDFFGTLFKYAAGVVGLATVTSAAACGSDPTPADAAGGNCLANGTTVTIASNHGHVLVVAKAEVMAAVDKTYDITGTADHSHMVTLTAANMTSLAGNHSVNVNSTSSGTHTHNITVVCA